MPDSAGLSAARSWPSARRSASNSAASAVAVQRVADLMQSNGLLAKSVNTGTLVKELITR